MANTTKQLDVIKKGNMAHSFLSKNSVQKKARYKTGLLDIVNLQIIRDVYSHQTLLIKKFR